MTDSIKDKPHVNIRGKEYFVRAIEEANGTTQTPIQRLRYFVKWAQSQGMCKSEFDFERQCGLSTRYIVNNVHTGKGNIGSEMLGRIVKTFPQLNLVWLCTGEGAMVLQGGDNALNADYKQAYEAAMMQIEALNRIIRSHNK